MIGDASIGFFAAIVPASATLASAMFPTLYSTFGKLPVVVFGMLCFFFFCLPFVLSHYPAKAIGNWTVLPPLFIMFGVGRAVYEGPNKAIWAEMFTGKDSGPSASHIFLQNGLMTTLCFYTFPSMDWVQMGTFAMSMSIFGIVGVLLALHLPSSEGSTVDGCGSNEDARLLRGRRQGSQDEAARRLG